MANTYTQIHLQFIFAPKKRKALILPEWEDDLYKYITGIVQAEKNKMLCINGMPDHIHIMMGFNVVSKSISETIQVIKANSSKWINDNKLTKEKFEWQSGYGCFSYSKSGVSDVCTYIENQKEHHKKRTFLEEYQLFLEKFEVEFDEKYIFEEPIE